MVQPVHDVIDRCAADMITVHTVGGTVSWASRSAERLFGWSRAALVGRAMAELAHPDDRERVEGHYQLPPRGDSVLRFRLRAADGSHRWVETRTRASREAGEALLVSITRDVYPKPVRVTSRSGVRAMYIDPLAGPDDVPGRRPTVLVVDDQPEMRQLLSAVLRHQYRVVVATNGEEALRTMRDEQVMAVVSDVVMPKMSGDQLLHAVRDDPDLAHVPVLLLTARADSDFRTRALRDGATDYVTKPFDRNELLARVENLVHSSAAFRALRKQTRIDTLTRVFNRAQVLSILDKQHELSLAGDYGLSVVMIDVDHFKRVNDRFGHKAGDEVLRDVAGRLAAGVRNGDAVGRYGGEEFLVVLPSCDYPRALSLAEGLCEAVRRTPVQTSAGPVRVTISGGVASSTGGRLEASTLVETADRALYRAKRSGRDRIAA